MFVTSDVLPFSFSQCQQEELEIKPLPQDNEVIALLLSYLSWLA